MILISALIFVLGSVLSGIAPHHGNYFLIISRVILGLAVGAASALVPAYMSEMAPAKFRGVNHVTRNPQYKITTYLIQSSFDSNQTIDL